MVKYQTLEQGSLSVGQLAEPHGMSLPGFMKHLRVLETAGLVSRAKDGRVVNLALLPEPMQKAAMWLSRYEKFCSDHLDALGSYLYQQEELNLPWKASKTAKTARTAKVVKAAAPGSGHPSTSPGTTRPRPKSGAPGPTCKH